MHKKINQKILDKKEMEKETFKQKSSLNDIFVSKEVARAAFMCGFRDNHIATINYKTGMITPRTYHVINTPEFSFSLPKISGNYPLYTFSQIEQFMFSWYSKITPNKDVDCIFNQSQEDWDFVNEGCDFLDETDYNCGFSIAWIEKNDAMLIFFNMIKVNNSKNESLKKYFLENIRNYDEIRQKISDLAEETCNKNCDVTDMEIILRKIDDLEFNEKKCILNLLF